MDGFCSGTFGCSTRRFQIREQERQLEYVNFGYQVGEVRSTGNTDIDRTLLQALNHRGRITKCGVVERQRFDGAVRVFVEVVRHNSRRTACRRVFCHGAAEQAHGEVVAGDLARSNWARIGHFTLGLRGDVNRRTNTGARGHGQRHAKRQTKRNHFLLHNNISFSLLNHLADAVNQDFPV